MNDALPVYIGFDKREEIAFDVARHSLLRHASIPLYVRALRLDGLRHAGLYRREHVTEAGQMIDCTDGRPFSTEFSFSRFLVPALCGYDGWALFTDSDFLFMADIAEIVPLLDDSKAVMVAKQVHAPDEAVKMDNQVQARYSMKNWSSFMLLNCGHPENRKLTVEAVNTRPGRWLHQFQWLPPDEIGDIPPAWNWIAGTTEGDPKAVHFTAGGCWFPEYTEVAFAQQWRDEYADACRKAMKEAA